MSNRQQENQILAEVLLGDYRGGLTRYDQLPAPVAEDLRWAGLCHLNLGHHIEARDLLARAVAQGCRAARIELAALYRFSGERELAAAMLMQLEQHLDSSLDMALLHREQAQQLTLSGDLKAAGRELEHAWISAGASWPGAPLRGPIAQLQGTVLSLRGLDQLAAERYEVAWHLGSPPRQVYALLARALSLTYLGRLLEAAHDLTSAQSGLAHVPVARAYWFYVHATFLRACLKDREADQQYAAAISQAQESGEEETEVHAELGRATLATAEGRAQARGHLVRAEQLAQDWKVTSS